MFDRYKLVHDMMYFNIKANVNMILWTLQSRAWPS